MALDMVLTLARRGLDSSMALLMHCWASGALAYGTWALSRHSPSE